MAANKFIVGDTAKNLYIEIKFNEVISVSGSTALLFHGPFGNYNPASAFMGPITEMSVQTDASSTTFIGTYDVTAVDTGAQLTVTNLSVHFTHPDTDIEIIKSADSSVEVLVC